jgi:hypothetical protein
MLRLRRTFFYQNKSELLHLSAIYHYSSDREIGVQSPSLANKNTCQANAANAMNFLFMKYCISCIALRVLRWATQPVMVFGCGQSLHSAALYMLQSLPSHKTNST